MDCSFFFYFELICGVRISSAVDLAFENSTKRLGAVEMQCQIMIFKLEVQRVGPHCKKGRTIEMSVLVKRVIVSRFMGGISGSSSVRCMALWEMIFVLRIIKIYGRVEGQKLAKRWARETFLHFDYFEKGRSISKEEYFSWLQGGGVSDTT